MKKELVKKAAIWIMLLPTRWRANRLNYKLAIRKAEESPKRCYIYFLGGKYRVYNRKQVQYLKNKGVLRPNMTLEKMQGIQLYDSRFHTNSHPLYTDVTVRGVNITYKRIKA